jgi:GNAT superfamily N-acetyltransferase
MLRIATEEDAGLVVAFMHKLGVYQKMAEAITATEAEIARLLRENLGEAVIASYLGEPVGFVYFCKKSSAFTGRAGLFIDGFLIDEDMRHKGFGKIMMGFMCRHAIERNCQMLEWGCLDWNAPTIQFYKDLGAYSIENMRIFRFTPDQLRINAALHV